MKTFDLFEIILRDALISPCRRYSLLAYQDIGDCKPNSHFGGNTLDGLYIAKLWDNEERKMIDTIVKQNEAEAEFFSLNSEILYLKDFKHPSGKDICTRIAQAIHEYVCNTRGRRDLIEVICSRRTYEHLRVELMSSMAYHPGMEPSGVIQFYGCKIRVSDDFPHDFLVTEVWSNDYYYHHSDHCSDAISYMMHGCGRG